MIQVIEQTHAQKLKMYLKCTKKKLAEMLIASNRHNEAVIIQENTKKSPCEHPLPARTFWKGKQYCVECKEYIADYYIYH